LLIQIVQPTGTDRALKGWFSGSFMMERFE